MTENSFDVIVIGGGPGGYVCAIRCAQLGLSTALVEKNPHLGGTCLNVGCIPSKSLLHSTEMYHFLSEKGAEHGIETSGLKINVKSLMKKKEDVVNKLRAGIQHLMKAKKITVLTGHGKVVTKNSVEVNGTQYTAKNIVLASGSEPVELPFMKFDGKTIVSSTEAIAFESVPKKMAIVGAGAIGLELGSVWSRLGSDVTIVELLPRVAITFDHEVSKMAERIFTKQGIKFELDAKVTGVKKSGKSLILTAEKAGKELEFPADVVVVCVGRRAYTEGLGLDSVGIEVVKGKIVTNNHLQTNIPNIYAIGDVINGPMLAHKAEEEGVAVANTIAGKHAHINYDLVPNVVYTDPELASVGISEQDAKERGIDVKVGKFPFAGNGRALANDAADGFVKVIACAKTDKLLGVQMIGRGASEMIASAAAHMTYDGSAEDVGLTMHAHPTMSETFKEAALAVHKEAIHSA